MSEVLVLVDHVDGAIRKPTAELLTVARRLGEPSAVFIGRTDHSAGAVAAVRKYGAAKVYLVDDSEIRDYLVAPKAEVLQQLAVKVSPAAILVTSSFEGKEIAGRLAVKLGSGLITDAVDVQEGPVTTQSVFAGNYTVRAKVTKGTPIIAVKPNSSAPEESDGAGAVEEFRATISESAKSARILASEPRQATGRPDLAEAAIVVAGGRGTGGDFTPVEKLADALGAAVGASRAAVDSGWISHAFQIGQTGKTVSPRLYIAGGISGAIQHRAGMQTSKAIVAVNTDADAPIFELADLGVVGDLRVVFPKVVELLAGTAGGISASVGTSQPEA
ncbi:electron transfer flavoprotein subunit alpha/FixB family protein [Kribbella solani]|uniref:Electron transfer flavoprotein alpha subunit n=1 Tax=Kribbella solani TaxID=236067 RepID=A0A841E0E3_9ACTN|nr:electron transfer flavoprotein subunit alpha/FixB family protein [Kribbella solani]MBB5980888.1 electron transfer flavoprotein alpha subunit [Kribbella solani]